jgi:hypothetical protein
MEREASATRSVIGKRAAGEAAGKEAWDMPRLTAIDIHDAQASVTIASDGLYAVS